MGVLVGFIKGTLTDEERDWLRGLLDNEPSPAPSGGGTAPPPPPVATGVGPYFDSAPGFVQAVIRAHFPVEAWEHAAGIAYFESGYRPEAHNTNGEDSRGLWQINVVPAANPDLLALGDLFDPDVNAQAARIVWERQGWAAWWNTAPMAGVDRSGPGVP